MRSVSFVARNDIQLLYCGGEFFPALIAAIEEARDEVYLETYIFMLDETGMPAERLELELTEGAAMDNPAVAITVMNELHARGVQLSIDDFGTGYSSLSYLKKFRVSKLKIDQSFVRDLTDDAEDRAIVDAVIRMAGALGLQTLAEGVETEGQLAFLRRQGCQAVQGYLFSRPLPAEAFETFVKSRLLTSVL